MRKSREEKGHWSPSGPPCAVYPCPFDVPFAQLAWHACACAVVIAGGQQAMRRRRAAARDARAPSVVRACVSLVVVVANVFFGFRARLAALATPLGAFIRITPPPVRHFYRGSSLWWTSGTSCRGLVVGGGLYIYICGR